MICAVGDVPGLCEHYRRTKQSPTRQSSLLASRSPGRRRRFRLVFAFVAAALGEFCTQADCRRLIGRPLSFEQYHASIFARGWKLRLEWSVSTDVTHAIVGSVGSMRSCWSSFQSTSHFVLAAIIKSSPSLKIPYNYAFRSSALRLLPRRSSRL